MKKFYLVKTQQIIKVQYIFAAEQQPDSFDLEARLTGEIFRETDQGFEKESVTSVDEIEFSKAYELADGNEQLINNLDDDSGDIYVKTEDK